MAAEESGEEVFESVEAKKKEGEKKREEVEEEMELEEKGEIGGG